MKQMLLMTFIFFLSGNIYAQTFIINKYENGSFSKVSSVATSIYTDSNDDWLIQKTALFFQDDIEKVTGKNPSIIHSLPSSAKDIIIIGSIKHSSLIQQLIQLKKINADSLKGKWEACQIQIIRKPFKEIDNVLLIAGSDKRETA